MPFSITGDLMVHFGHRCAALLSVLLLCCLATVSAAEERPLRILTVSLPPYGYMEDREITGLTYDLANAIVLEAGFEAVNVIGPLTRGIKEMETGDADLVIMLPNEKVTLHAESVGAVFSMEMVVIGRPDSVLRSLRDVRGKKLATVKKAKYDDRISRKSGMVLYPTDTYSQSLKMLLAHRVDFVIGPKLGLQFTAKQLKLPRKALGQPLSLSKNDAVLFLSKKSLSPGLREKLQDALERLQKNGTINSIVRKYSL